LGHASYCAEKRRKGKHELEEKTSQTLRKKRETKKEQK